METYNDTETTTQSIEDRDNVYKLLTEIFESSIEEADVSDLIKNVGTLYDSFSGQGFETSFKNVLMVVFSTSKRSSDVRKILYFIADCVVTLDNEYKAINAKGSEEDIDDVIHPLLQNLFQLLIRWSAASNFTVRFRSCQLLYLILTHILDRGVGEIDMQIYEKVSKLIENRMLDVSCNVRAHAVLLAKFFQDPSSVNDPVIASLCWQLQYDPNFRVRQNIVGIIAACEETIVPIAKRFLYDKNANVRNAALLHICNRISPHSFTSTQRILIFKQCFFDSSDLVRRSAEQRLIPVWFRAYKDKLCRFFKDLRIGNESLDNLIFINELIRVLSKCVKIAQIVEEIGLDPETGLPNSTLNGEQVFLWRHFYALSNKDSRLSKFIPEPEALIEYIINCFTSTTYEEDQTLIFNELILFLINVIDSAGVDKCEKVFPVMLNVMKNPYVSHEVMPYLITLYLTCVNKEKEFIHEDVVEVIDDLLKLKEFAPMGQEKNILLKCFALASQLLTEEETLTSSLRIMKEKLIIHYISSEDAEIKIKAITALALYCLIDINEAKSSWSLFANAIHLGPSHLKYTLLKGCFDLLRCYGAELFSGAIVGADEEKFIEAVDNIISHMEDEETERDIVVQGILKLYFEHHTRSSVLLSRLVIMYFHPEKYHSINHLLEIFFRTYGETREQAQCLIETFLNVIDLLFDSNKHSPFHKVGIKKAALQLIEFSKRFETTQQFTLEENFTELLVLKLTKKFPKKPWRLTALDLYSVCNSVIPKNFESLVKLKDNIKLIIESLHCAIFQQKNPYSKRSIKQFSCYKKKIQAALNALPVTEQTIPLAEQSQALCNSSVDDIESSTNSREAEISVYASPIKGTTPLTKNTPALRRTAARSCKKPICYSVISETSLEFD